MGILAGLGYSSPSTEDETPPWVEALATVSSANDSPYEIPEVDDDFSIGDLAPWNIVKGLGKGVSNLAKGLGSLAMLGLGDIRSGIADVAEEIVPGAIDRDRDYFTDDIAKAMIFDPARSDKPGLAGVWEDSFGAVKDDWVRRYVEPLRNEGIGGLASSILSDPLPAALDVVGAGVVGGKVASVGARATYRAGKVAKTGIVDELANVGELKRALAIARDKGELGEVPLLQKKIAEAEEALSPSAAFVHSVHPGRGMPAVTLGVNRGKKVTTPVSLGGVETVIGAPTGSVPVAFKALSPNPARRGLQRLMSNAASRPLDTYLGHIKKTKEDMSKVMDAEVVRGIHPFTGDGLSPGQEKLASVIRENQAMRVLGRQVTEEERLVARAMQYGMERIPYEPVLKYRAKKTFDKIAGRYTTTFYGARDEYTQAFVDLIEEYNGRGVPTEDMVIWAQADTLGRKGTLLPDGTAATVAFQDLVDTVATQVGRDPEFDPEILTSLGDERLAAATAAMPDGFTFNADKMRLTLSNWDEAPTLIEKLAAGFGGTAEILQMPDAAAGNFSGVLARITTPEGASFKVQALTPDSAAVADAIDDFVEPMMTWRAELPQLEAEFKRLDDEAKHLTMLLGLDNAGFLKYVREGGTVPNISYSAMDKLQADTYKRRYVAKQKMREVQREIKASEAIIEDLGELHMYQLMRRGGLDGGGADIEFEGAELIARLRVMRHGMTVGPARKKGKFQSPSQMMERAYLPMKLELFSARSEKFDSAVKALEDALESGDKVALDEAIEGLGGLGYIKSVIGTSSTPMPGLMTASPREVGEAMLEQQVRQVLRMASKDGATGKRFQRLADAINAGDTDPDSLGDTVPYFKALGYESDDPTDLLQEIILDAAENPRSHEFVLGDLEDIGNVTMWEYFHDLYRAAGKQTPIYIPHIDGRRTKPSDWLMQKYTQGWTQKAHQGWNTRALGHVYQSGQYITDVAEAYSRRAAQVRKYMDMMDMHQELVDTFGRPITFMDEIGPGEALMAPKLTEHYFRGRAQAEEEMIRLMDRGVPEGEAIIDGAKAAFVKLEDVPRSHMPIEDYIRSIDPDGNLAKLAEDGTPLFYAVPKIVAQRLDDMAKFHLGWKFRIFWDGPLNVWRAAVLAFSPRWLIYNLLGNTMFTTLQGANVVDAFKLMGQKTGRAAARKFGIDDWTPKFLRRVESAIADLGEDAQRAVSGGFFSSTEQGVRHLGMAEDTSWGQLVKGLRAEKPVKWGATISARMRKLNEVIEESFRQTSFIKAMDRQIADAGEGGKFLDVMDKARIKAAGQKFIRSQDKLERMAANGVPNQAAIEAAIDEVNFFMNDYMTLSPIERNVVKRYIMPFYSFYKHQAKLITSYSMHSPGAASLLRRLGLISQELAQDFGNMPDWMMGQLPIGFGKNGEKRYYNTRSANPFNAMLEGPSGLFTGLAPQARGVWEWGSGQDIVTGKPHTSASVVTPFGSRQGYRMNPQTGEMEPAEARVDPLEIALQQFPQFELGRDIATGANNFFGGTGDFETGARYSTGEVITDPYGNPVFPGSVWQKIGQYLGYSTSDYDQTTFTTREQEMERAALIGLLRRKGILPMPVEGE